MLPLLLVNVDHKIHSVLPYSNLNEDVSCYKNPNIQQLIVSLV